MVEKVIDNATRSILLIGCPILAGLSAEGVKKVDFVANGDEALRFLCGRPVDAVVVDQDIGEVNLFRFVQALRNPAESPRPGQPVVLVAKEATARLVGKAIMTGVDQIIVKPISPALLVMTVDDLLANPQEQVDIASYVGPCRRRLEIGGYSGVERRDESP